MSATLASPSSTMRRAWMAVLARTPRADLEAALNRALQGVPPPAYDWLRPPEIGLAMVRGRVGGSGDPFNLAKPPSRAPRCACAPRVRQARRWALPATWAATAAAPNWLR